MRGFFPRLQRFSQTSLFFYLVLLLIYFLLIDHTKIGIRELNQYRLPIDYLVKFSDGLVPFDKERFQRQLVYYQRALKYLPNSAEVSSMLAFCYYYLGKPKESIWYYEMALKQNRYFFWFHYDLGLIYFKKKDYANAVKYLREGLATNPQLTLGLTRLSKIFLDLEYRKNRLNSFDELYQLELVKGQDARLKKAMERSYELIVVSLYHLQNYRDMFELAFQSLNSKMESKDMFYYYAGLASYQMNAFSQAAYFLQKSVERFPDHADSCHYLGMALKDMHETGVSQIMLNKAAALRSSGQNSKIFDLEGLKLQIF